MDMESLQLVADGRKDIAIALQLDDDQLVGGMVVACLEVVEAHVEVDGEAFCLGSVDKRHAVKLVAHHGCTAQAREHRLYL